MVPECLYRWLGAVSGLIIAGLGLALFLRRYAGAPDHHHHGHDHGHGHPHDHAHSHADDEHRDAPHHPHLVPAGGKVTLRELLALGVTGDIVPCPAALVVLLSAVALRRVGFGLFLIVAFSVGLAAVLIAIGLLMVYARRAMARFQGDGQLITRWLPLTSSAVITLLGVGIAVQALMAAGILHTLEYLLVGKGPERFLAHAIFAPPNFDQVLSVKSPGLALTDADLSDDVRVSVPDRKNVVAERLREGQKVQAILRFGLAKGKPPATIRIEAGPQFYFEEGELRVPPTFKVTPEDKKG